MVSFKEGVDYHLLKRKRNPRRGSPYHVWYIGILSDVRDKNGRRKYAAMKVLGRGTEALARKRAKAVLDDGSLFASKDNIETFLIDFWTPGKSAYLRAKEARKKMPSAQYLEAHRSAIRRHFLPFFEERGITKLNELCKTNLEEWQNWCHLDQEVSARTTNRTRQAVFTALRWAVDSDMLPRHPGQKIEKLPEEKPRRLIFERDELEKLFAVQWPDFRAYAAAALAEATGMRLGEVRGLLVKNVHLDERYVDVVTNYVEPGVLKHPKWKPDGRLGISISPLAADAIQRVLDKHQWGAGPDHFVFFDFDRPGQPMSKEAIGAALKDAMKAAKLPGGRTFHCLRHSAISHYGPLMSPGQRLAYFGHSSEEMSLHYSHETAADKKRLAKKQMKIIPFPKAQGE